MSQSPLIYEQHDNVGVVRMNDGKVNALSYDMIDAFLAAMDRAEKEASALVIAGQPGRFCAGFDLKEMTRSPQAAVDLLTHGCELYMRLYGFKLPVIIACTGHAVAGGALLALCGDVRIGAAGDFKMGLNEVAIKMPLPVLAIELARARLKTHALTAATLCAQLYAPEAAVDAGYLDQVVQPDELMATAIGLAGQMGQLDRHAFMETKKRLRGATITHIMDTLETDMAGFAPPQVGS